MIIDVSYHQGIIDWRKVKAAGVTHALIKATGEETAGPNPFRDPKFERNWNEAATFGVKRGAYHFMDGGKDSGSGKAEAEFLIKTVESAGGWGEVRPTIDVEWPPQGGHLFDIAQLDECVEIVAQRILKTPMAYTGRWYWERIPNRDSYGWLGDCPLWIASYTAVCPLPPSPWGGVSLWQYTNQGRVDGIDGDVDLNRLLVPESAILL